MNEYLFSIITAVITSAVIHLVIRFRTFSNFLGVLCILSSLPLTYLTWKEYSSFPSQPVTMFLSEAVSKLPSDNLWVNIKDINWDCDRLYHISFDNTTETNIFFSDPTGEFIGIATFNQKLSCSEISNLSVSGILSYMSARRKSFFEKNGIVVVNQNHLLSYCTYCGRTNTKYGILMGVFLFGCGLLLLVVDIIDQYIKRRRYMKETAQHSVHLTLGILRTSQAFSTPEPFSGWTASPSPPQRR